ncbi:fungal-trans domain-containing protein [Favolaschia claudopus]|uniref:Fungal-trans domain-containing protein n=1 Tax=Favolaschia claudopus TaxID=2862362 RepID=A0AAW0C561_9AGAR
MATHEGDPFRTHTQTPPRYESKLKAQTSSSTMQTQPQTQWQNIVTPGQPLFRRQQPSCDLCRTRKSGGRKTEDGACASCISLGFTCTFDQPYRKRGPKFTKNRTVEDLQKENSALKAKLQSATCSVCARPLQERRQQQQENPGSARPRPTPSPPSTSARFEEPPDDQGLMADELASRFSQFGLTPSKVNYFGEDSSFALVNNASMMKEQFLGRSTIAHSRRPYFWQVLPWEKELIDLKPCYIFPPPDLMSSLVQLYFTVIHTTIPFLHRPSFERGIAQGLHYTNKDFGGMVLSVLAVASRYSKDPRVFLSGGAPFSAGWKFRIQVQEMRKIGEEHTIYEIQTYVLLALYAFGTSVPHFAWLFTALGIRCLQQRGVHRRKPDGYRPTLEDEMWKRAFWTLVSIERFICLFLGRPLGIHVEQYDADFPMEIDDEYLERGMDQPPRKPSQLTYYVCYLKLSEILGDTMRRLYGSKKAKVLLGWDGPGWEQRVVAELHSKMNKFADTVPAHLRWDPKNPPYGAFFDQAATLHIIYNYILMAIHRRYIQQPSLQATPSLAICADSARTIIHTADVWITELQRLPGHDIHNPVFVSGIVLVLYTLATRRAGLLVDKNKDLVRVGTALEILKFAESRIQGMGRLWELLRELWLLDGPLPLSDPTQPGSVDVNPNSPATTASTSNASIAYYQLPEQPSDDSWTSMLSRDSTPESMRGKSVEELLGMNGGSPSDLANVFDDQLMSLWMGGPFEPRNPGPEQWAPPSENSYASNSNTTSPDANWSPMMQYAR